MLHPRNLLTIVPCAIGPKNGTLTLHVSPAHLDMSSASTEWLSVAKRLPEHNGYRWDQEITVPTVTLDSLIAKYGTPDFIKIDVEGFEGSALDGLTRAPKYTRFEFHPAFLESAIECVNKPCFGSLARFNYSIGEPYGELRLAEGLPANEFCRILQETKFHDGEYGDILVTLMDLPESQSRQ